MYNKNLMKPVDRNKTTMDDSSTEAKHKPIP